MGEVKEDNLIFSFKKGNAFLGVKLWEGDKDIYTLKQTHSDRVILLENIKTEQKEGDAIITTLRGVKIGVRTADCVPIALLGSNAVGVIHAGWRGLKSGIIEKAIRVFERFEEIKDLTAFLGPSARACCYQVGEEFKELFLRIHYKNGAFFLDTQEEALAQLKSLGVRKVVRLSSCTICNTKYPSYRRDKTKERLITYAMLLPLF